MNKWRKRARRWKRWRDGYTKCLETMTQNRDAWENRCIDTQVERNALSESEAAALNQTEEYRQQVLTHAKTNADLREHLVALQESDMLDLLEKKRLLAWQRGVREALTNYMRDPDAASALQNLRQAIESAPDSSNFDFKAYMTQVEEWGKAHDWEGEPGKGEP